jgi:hypothetical protein
MEKGDLLQKVVTDKGMQEETVLHVVDSDYDLIVEADLKTIQEKCPSIMDSLVLDMVENKESGRYLVVLE